MAALQYILWNVGMDAGTVEEIAALLEAPCRIKPLEPADCAVQAAKETPFLVCCRARLWPDALAAAGSLVEPLFHLPLLLVLDGDESPAERRQTLAWGAMDVAENPLDRSRLVRSLRKASEMACLRQDLTSMTREIFLQRELLEFKTEALAFLSGFLMSMATERTPSGLMQAAARNLDLLFPLLSLHLALREGHGPFGQPALFLTLPQGHAAEHEWRTGLSPLLGDLSPERKAAVYHLPEACVSDARPQDGHSINLPLMNGTEKAGALVVLTSLERSLSRDQATALEAAMRHMTLLLPSVFRLPLERAQRSA